MSSPKEIAEMIINQNEFKQEDFVWLVNNSEVLARAYLELEKKLSLEQQDRESEKREFKVFKDAAENEITKLKEEIQWRKEVYDKLDSININLNCEVIELKSEITKLKKSREWLRKAVEFYGVSNNYNYDNFNAINYIWSDRGKTAREALKADDELIGGGNG